MRDYGKVFTTFWSSETVRSMSEDARNLALYLLTSPHSTIAGVFRLPDGYACEDLQWSSQRVGKGFDELISKGFANRCETTKWAWICKHLEWNPPENPNQRKSAAKVADSIPTECTWKREFMRVCGPLLGLEPLPEENPCATLDEPFLNQEQEQEQEQEEEEQEIVPSKEKKGASGSLLNLKFELPEWVPKEAWEGFVEMRKRLRKPMTDRARDLKIAELQRFRDSGFNVGTILDKSTANCWVDVYEPKDGEGMAATEQRSFV